MSTAITGTTAVTTTYASDAMKSKLGMNKDDFLKLFIAQLQNQDPMNPQDPTEFLSQLAQLTQVEQAYNSTAALEKLLTAQNNTLAASAVDMIGKEVAASGNQISFDGTNPAAVSYALDIATATTTMTITNASGQTVRTIDMGSQSAGSGSYQWDGKDGQGNLLPAGAYNITISGRDASGMEQQATTSVGGKVDGVTFSNGIAYLSIGSIQIPFTSITSVKGV